MGGPAEHLVPFTDGWSLWRLAALRSAGMPIDWLERLAGADPDGDAVSALLDEQRFLEALAWQNPAALDNWIGRHAEARAAGRAPALKGKRAALLARYAQRYCAKNDTIGHFGAVAWAHLDAGASGVRREGGGGIRTTSVHFETWALEVLADTWRGFAELRPHLPVRLHPAVSFDGGELRRPWRAPSRPGGLTASVLSRLSTTSVFGELVTAVRDACGSAEEDVVAEVDAFERAGVVVVGFAVPLDEWPERTLRAQLARVPEEARARAEGQLDDLERHRARIAAAHGLADPVGEALSGLAAAYRAMTGRRSARGKEETRTGRSIVYSDSRRDLDVTLGGDVLDPLRGSLGMLLRSARWLAAEVADAVEEQAEKQFAELRGRADRVYLGDLYLAMADVLSGAPGTAVHRVVEDFQQRWAEVLGEGGSLDPEGGLRFSTDELGPITSVLFPDRAPRWSAARHHSPDVMLAESERGPRWVLGELHVALNTLESRVFHTQADDRRYLLDAVARDMAGGRVVALLPNDSPEVSPRTYPPLAAHVPDRYVYWSFGRDAGPPAGAVSTQATSLVVRDSGAGLRVGPVRASWDAPLLEALGEFLTALVVNRFELRARTPHAPRISIGDLVVCRESWRLAAGELPVRADLLVGALRDRGVPRHVFVRTEAEAKPFYVDLEAPLLVRNLVRAARLAAALPSERSDLNVVEMLPGPEQLWVRDSAGARYTSEFRLVAVDDHVAPGIDNIRAEA